MQPNEAPKFAVHAPQAEPQSAPQADDKASSTHAEGSATIKAGENMVAVTHGLEGRPNVRLNFSGADHHDKFSYIILVGKSFQVNLSAPVTEDTPFTWSADT